MTKLRRKFVLAVMASSAAVLLLTALLTVAAVWFSEARRADDMTRVIAENDGDGLPRGELDRMFGKSFLSPFGGNEESFYRMRYFTVRFTGDTAGTADVAHIVSVNAEEAVEIALAVRKLGRETGYRGDFRFRVTEDKVILLDCSDELDSLRNIALITSLIALLFVVLITVVFYFISGRVLRPFEENARMQKRFITDASHELKTPLAIISANAEVLEYKEGGSEWLGNITAQVGRMSGLINEMLTLSRLEEIEVNTDVKPVDMSALTRGVASEFSEVFERKGVKPAYAIDDGVVMNGDEDQLRRLVSVLADNAAKYVPENGAVGIKLKKDSRHVYLSVFNTCELDKNADLDHLFERFYRPDASRASGTGGHGIGLSVAKRIADLHGGTIEARPEGDGICFRATLSSRLKAGRKA